MARLSDPDSAMEKIETLYEKVEALFETIDLIQALKDRFQTACDRMSEREAGLTAQIARNRDLESAVAASLDGVETLQKETSAKTETLLSEFHAKARDIADTLAALRAENSELEEDRALLENELSRFGLFMEGTQEAIEALKIELTDFRDGVRRDLEERSDAFHGSLSQALSLAREELNRMGDRFRQTLMERADDIDETTLAKLAALQKEVQDKGGALEAKIAARLTTSADAVDALRADAESRIEAAVTASEAAVQEEKERVAGFLADAGRTIDGLAADLEKLKDETAAELIESKATVDRRQTELAEQLQGEMIDRIARETDALRKTHEELTGSLREEIAGKVEEIESALAGVEEKRREMDAAQNRLQSAMEDLAAFRERLKEQGDAAAASIQEWGSDVEAALNEKIDHALSTAKKMSEEQAAGLTAQVRKVLSAERRKAQTMGETVAGGVKAQADGLTAFMAGAEEQIYRLSRDLDGFREQAEAEIRDRLSDLEGRQGIAEIKGYINRLVQHSNKSRQIQDEQIQKTGDQGDALAKMEKRIGRIEALLLRKKKGAGNGGKGGESPPSRTNS